MRLNIPFLKVTINILSCIYGHVPLDYLQKTVNSERNLVIFFSFGICKAYELILQLFQPKTKSSK